MKGAAPGTFFPGYGGGPKRKHRQMHQAYAHAEGGGRRVRKPDVLGDSDSETTSEEQDGDVDGGALDVDHSGTISLSEFLELASSMNLPKSYRSDGSSDTASPVLAVGGEGK